MASYDYDIANLALARLGQGTITSLGAAGRDATVCNLFYTQNRDWCLKKAPWLSVRSRVHLVRGGTVAITGITAAEPPVVTCSGHLFTEGDLVTIEDIVGMTEVNDGVFVAKSVTSTTIALYDTYLTMIDGTAYTAFTSGGFAYFSPGDEWQYVYDIPSGCLKVERVLDDEFGWTDTHKWLRVRDRLYTNVEYAGMEYVARETDVAEYDDDLVEFMSTRLAWLICPRISNDVDLRRTLRDEWMLVLSEGEAENADGGSDDGAASPLWTGAHL